MYSKESVAALRMQLHEVQGDCRATDSITLVLALPHCPTPPQLALRLVWRSAETSTAPTVSAPQSLDADHRTTLTDAPADHVSSNSCLSCVTSATHLQAFALAFDITSNFKLANAATFIPPAYCM